ncbi:hypothetical protein VIBNIPon4_120038 [Vibrio nigripulchritudo POn4]|nr:hypothetical protein VIBNIAM115_1680037 [Vibrio nigripulchritudo AM115]CCN39675.1 hypothetical protein VIBNIFTn2_1100038 [Vibrio nigripulchritudo FTn2]CCN63301.1 hypothetical protein VIBNIPon4_120038 [Vibrio nigripulchritudo POn4]
MYLSNLKFGKTLASFVKLAFLFLAQKSPQTSWANRRTI